MRPKGALLTQILEISALGRIWLNLNQMLQGLKWKYTHTSHC